MLSSPIKPQGPPSPLWLLRGDPLNTCLTCAMIRFKPALLPLRRRYVAAGRSARVRFLAVHSPHYLRTRCGMQPGLPHIHR